MSDLSLVCDECQEMKYACTCEKQKAQSSLDQAPRSAWDNAEIHFEMAKAAWKLAARNEDGAAMAIEHMERAIASLKAITPNAELRHGGEKEERL